MKILLCFVLVVLTLSCRTNNSNPVDPRNDTVPTEYPDWYIIKAPIDKAIEGVWGDWNQTLLISTGYAIFRSTDQGKHWKQVHEQSIGMFSIVQYRDTLFTMTGLANYQTIINADKYSIDDGQRWQSYTGRGNLVFDYLPSMGYRGFPINPVIANREGASCISPKSLYLNCLIETNDMGYWA